MRDFIVSASALQTFSAIYLLPKLFPSSL